MVEKRVQRGSRLSLSTDTYQPENANRKRFAQVVIIIDLEIFF